MLTDTAVTAILPVSDMSRATAFYRDTLGLHDAGENPGGNRMLRAGAGATIELLPVEKGAQTAHTVLTFEVSDLKAEIAELEAKQVSFADYDEPGLTTVDHIATVGAHRAAWFTDTEGNFLCLHEEASG